MVGEKDEQQAKDSWPRWPMIMAGILIAGGVFSLFIAFNKSFRADPDAAPAQRGMEAINETGTLTVLTVAGPSTYQMKNGLRTGYEVDLARALAEDLGVDTEFKLYPDLTALRTAIEEGEGQIAAAGLTREERKDTEAVFGPAYKTIRHIIVCGQNTDTPCSLSEMTGKSFGVVADSGVEQKLGRYAENISGLAWQSRPAANAMTLLKEVSKGELDCTIAESNILAIARRRYGGLVSAFELGAEDRQYAWLIAPNSPQLVEHLTAWFEKAHERGLLYDLDERYYGHLDEYDDFDISKLRTRIDTRLPRYDEYFRTSAGTNNLDWTLLAAQGYQESHWDPKAKSPTGVRGIMMLTRPTAREVGISNRLDPEQSIRGGAKYMDYLYDRLPDAVTGYDRLWMAMAAYNVGYGHLMDARRLAERQGRDKNKWSAINDTLPLLTKKEHYSTVPHGYARGYEPVRYVRRIREYDEVLTNSVRAPEQPPFLLQRPPEPETTLAQDEGIDEEQSQ